MPSVRCRKLAAAVVVFGVTSVVAGAAPALAQEGAVTGSGPCAFSSPGQGQGGTAGVVNLICQGSGTTDIGPAVGQSVVLVGPVITGSAPANVIISAGDVAGVIA